MPPVSMRLSLLVLPFVLGCGVPSNVTPEPNLPVEAVEPTEVPTTDGLPEPRLDSTFDYVGGSLPAHFLEGRSPTAQETDNTPADNPVTNAGAALGRVLFYDVRLSANDTVSCASCHRQANGFSDPRRLSLGFAGGSTARHSMGLTNARFYDRGRFFWDERALTLEAQVLMPIQDATEMGMTLPALEKKLAAVAFYRPLFTAAFGDEAVTADRISRALAQFVRTLISFESKFDAAFAGGGAPDFESVFTAEELHGLELFQGRQGATHRNLGCQQCHQTAAHVLPAPHNIGLDVTHVDVGAGNGRFKAPSLRNVAVRAPYMHDGRFASLAEVLDFYSTGIQANPGLSPQLRVGDAPNGAPERFNLTAEEKAALLAFLATLTDPAFLGDPRFSDPFGY